MKTIQIIIISAILVFLFSCEAGIKKDLTTGLKVSNKNLSVEESYVTVDGKKTMGNEFLMNSNLELILEGVSGYVLTNDLVFIGASMTLTDSNNTEIMNYPDLFSDYDETGISLLDSKQITLTLTTGAPMESNHSYIWKTRVWDKKGEGEIATEMKINIK